MYSQDSNNELQVCLIATRRPEILEITLESFNRNLFCNFSVKNFFANLDPAFGDLAQHKLTKECIRDYFPNAIINEPKEASFGHAVKWAWGQFNSGLALHLEDDWKLEESVVPQDVYSKLKPGYSAVTLCGNHKKWYKRRSYLWVGCRRTSFPYLGVTKVAALGTQPKFICGSFAYALSKLIDPALDPEKQMLPHINPAFSALIQNNKCGFLDAAGSKTYGVLTDLGRVWREQRGIVKVIEHGKSIWIEGENN